MSDLLYLLNLNSSRKNTDNIVDYISKNKSLVAEIVSLSFTGKYPINMRASWALSHYCGKNKKIIQPYVDKIILQINSNTNTGVKRNFMKIFAYYTDLSKIEKLGSLVDLSISLFNNPAETIAVRAYCLDILLKVGKQEPDLIPEIIESILFHHEHLSAGLKNKAKKIITQLTPNPQMTDLSNLSI